MIRNPFIELKVGIWRISPLLLVTLAAMLIIDGTGFCLIVPMAALIHEAGHYRAIKKNGGVVRALRLSPCGITMVKQTPPLCSYGRELRIHLAGPAANAAAALLASAAYLLTGLPSFAPLFAFCNLALMTVNLLPIRQTDGGSALEAWLLLRQDPFRVDKILKIADISACVFLGGLGLIVLIATLYNFSLLLMAGYLATCAAVDRYAQKQIMKSEEEIL